jgi:DNA-binding transcriptional regulator LsrR (DeoR family)
MMNAFEGSKNEKDSALHHGRNHDQLVSRVARMYYEERLNQSEIATQFRISQGTVSRLLRKAEECKIIRTTVDVPAGTFVDLEELLERKFGLRQVIIAYASIDSVQSAQQAVGAAAGHFLEMSLKSKSVIGVAPWSESLLSVVQQMRHVWKVSDCQVVQLLGGIGHATVEKDPSYLVRQLADLVQGDAHLLPAPGIAASEAMLDVLRQDPLIRQTTDLFERISIALFEVSSIKPPPSLIREENTIQQFKELAQRGAVGHLCLHFYDIEGEEIKGPLRSRVFGLETAHIKRIPTTIGIVYERGEHSAILGALRGHWINVLITDQFTAQSLVMT